MQTVEFPIGEEFELKLPTGGSCRVTLKSYDLDATEINRADFVDALTSFDEYLRKVRTTTLTIIFDVSVYSRSDIVDGEVIKVDGRQLLE